MRCGDSLAGEHAIRWREEFPEIFERENPGFDLFIGNPPFAGKNTLAALPRSYLRELRALHPDAHGNADLVAHFFRRAFSLLREGGALGFIATNTIAQGDTRASGLAWILAHGGTIFDATRRYRWPPPAAVIVSVVHVLRGLALRRRPRLDGREVERISAFLFHTGPDHDPAPLAENAGKSFAGSIVLGMGFTFDDQNPNATPTAEMRRLIEKNPSNAERIFPYLGGEELNTSPTHTHRRWVIDFGDLSEEEARRRWPDLLAIVEEKVRPEREKLADNPDGRRRKRFWWRWGRPTPALDAAIKGLDRVLLTNAQAAAHHAFVFQPPALVFANSLNVFALSTWADFAILQCSVHELWARFLCSSLKDDLRYNPSDCFRTFPFPAKTARIEAAGRAYYEHRAAIMQARRQGLTATYNRFYDPSARDDDIAELRALHAEMDRAVLEAYGWTDLEIRGELPRDELLARLLALNAERKLSIAAT